MSAKTVERARDSRSPEEAALEVLRAGYRERDAAKVLSAYAEDVEATIAADGSLAYRVECRYPDGCNVTGLYMATVKDGLIVREFSIDCWDE